MDKFTQSYVTCALWSTNDNSDEQGGNPLDQNYDYTDFSDELTQRVANDCAAFQAQCDELISEDIADWEQAGHDFWLTRNGHGAGFWDGDWPVHGDKLTAIAERFGELDIYVGDDGKLYV